MPAILALAPLRMEEAVGHACLTTSALLWFIC